MMMNEEKQSIDVSKQPIFLVVVSVFYFSAFVVLNLMY